MAPAIKWILALPLEIVAGFGCFAVAGIAHEGLHGSLQSDRHRSAIVGALLSAPIPGFYAPGFYVLHAQHHRYVNTSSDPVAAHYSKFNGALRRLFVARIAEGPRYLIETARLLKPGREPLSALVSFDTLRRAAWVTVATKIVLLALSVALLIQAPFVCAMVIAIPAAVSVLIASAVPFLEHAQTLAEPETQSARTHASPVFTLLRLGANFHLAHHLFPAIPCWRLARVHAELTAHDPQTLSPTTDAHLIDAWKALGRPYGIHQQPSIRAEPRQTALP